MHGEELHAGRGDRYDATPYLPAFDPVDQGGNEEVAVKLHSPVDGTQLTCDRSTGLAKVDAEQCNRPTDSLNGQFKLVYWLFSVFIYGPYGLRIISRGFITKQLWWDDFFHTVAIVSQDGWLYFWFTTIANQDLSRS